MGTRGPDLAWTEDAACREYPVELFYAEGKGVNLRDAKRICADCPVVTQCLDYADAYETGVYETGVYGNDTSYAAQGIYGGLSPQERRKRRKASQPVTEAVA